MNQANIGGDDIPRGRVSLADDMATFDGLPVRVKLYLRDMGVNWNAVGVRQIIDGYGEDIALAVLAKQEADMQDAYRARVGLQ